MVILPTDFLISEMGEEKKKRFGDYFKLRKHSESLATVFFAVVKHVYMLLLMSVWVSPGCFVAAFPSVLSKKPVCSGFLMFSKYVHGRAVKSQNKVLF